MEESYNYILLSAYGFIYAIKESQIKMHLNKSFFPLKDRLGEVTSNMEEYKVFIPETVYVHTCTLSGFAASMVAY